jgi:6-pyruvoyltetrahydropterin/6-carboxytetrahydropterin synthase
MYTVGIRDHFMIAHSLKGAVFGPAQGLHGATYVVDVELRSVELDADGVVVDIGLASSLVREVLGALSYRNLDVEPALQGLNTTTERLARLVFDGVAAGAAQGKLGPGASGLKELRVTLHESHVAWASFEGSFPVG